MEKLELLIDQFLNSCTSKKMAKIEFALTELIESSWDGRIILKSKNEDQEVT